MAKREDTLKAIQTALGAFTSGSLANSTKGLLNALEYDSDKTFELSPNTYQEFYEVFASKTDGFSAVNARADEWTSADIVFQVADEDLNQSQDSMFSAKALQEQLYDSFLFMAIELKENSYTRTDLAKITREVNKCFEMPVVILFRHGDTLTLAVVQRRQNLKASDKNVLAKVTLIKDVSFQKPHTAHLKILAELSLDNLADRKKHRISNFETLFEVWQEVLSTTELNKRFYRELSAWYFWALQHARFPKLSDEDANRKEVALIRLITRLIFVWFLKEKDLVPEALFDEARINRYLGTDHQIGGGSDSYYKAILQNLFFATLNTEMNQDVPESRYFKDAIKGKRFHKEHGVTTVYRYKDYFQNPAEALRLFENVPFLNGGLFECLDRTANDSASKRVEKVDGFSDEIRFQANVPDKLFFGKEDVDLNEARGTKNKSSEHVRGILDIFNSYKFTVDENTPIEEEVALDPELLGKVFENLLASYNPETETTARKQTGSFYTPREIVNYMVDESLIAYFAGKLTQTGMAEETAQKNLQLLFSYLDKPHPFTDAEVATLISAIDEVKILDPACGSGAFPMGVLLRLVELIGQLDPNNERWQKQQLERVIAPVLQDKQRAGQISYDKARESAIADLDERLKEIRSAFAENDHNYARKLFLIENCIYGVDIQPIAVQIAKLRFFVSLIVDQHVNEDKANRGVLPLPNLETKFVAANTLLGIDKPDQGMFEDPELIQKQEELKGVRHEHFKARRYVQKRKLRDRDKQLRHEIAELLKRNVFQNNDGTAERLANWNPYDQNARADFFDSEWMFGETGGYSVTIGNPPYVRADASEENRELRQKIMASGYYETLWEKWDLFIPFIELGYKLLKPNGVTTMIVSDAYCHSKYAQKSQEWFLENSKILRLDFLSKIKVFEAGVHNITYFFQKADGGHNEPERRVHEPAFGNFEELPTEIQEDLTYRAFFPEDVEAQKYSGKTISLDRLCYVSKGMVTNAHEKLAKSEFKLEDLVSDLQDKRHPKPFAEGKNVSKWLADSNSWLEWGTLRAPALFSRPTFTALYEQDEKLFLVKVGEIRAAYDSERLYCNEGIYVCIPWHQLRGVRNRSIQKYTRYASEKSRPDLPKRETLEETSRRFSAKYLLAILNSSVARHYLMANRRNNVQLYPDDWKQLPIPDGEKPQSMETLVDYILHFAKEIYSGNVEPQSKVIYSYLERILDGMVYELYLPDELHAAGRHIIKHVEAEHLPALEDIEGDKLAALQGIFERLYAKDHPVRENLYFLDSLETVRIIEGKAVNGQTKVKVGA